MTPTLGTLTAGLLALVLAGCATTSGPGSPQASRVESAAARTAAGPTEAERNPDRLRGLDPDSVARLIGMPNYVRRDGGVTVWQYHAGGCVMDLFWYPVAGAQPRLAHYEVRGVRLASVAEPRDCFGDLLVRRRDGTT